MDGWMERSAVFGCMWYGLLWSTSEYVYTRWAFVRKRIFENAGSGGLWLGGWFWKLGRVL